MAIAFPRCLRALEGDRAAQPVWRLLLVAALLGGWGTWLLVARVAVYETSDRARLEVERAAHPIEALLGGRVIASRIAVGQTVKAGDLLVKLDASAFERRLDEEQHRLSSLDPQRAALRRELSAEETAHRTGREAARAASDEARARQHAAAADSRISAETARRLGVAHAKGATTELDLLRARAEAEKHQAGAEAEMLGVSRLEKEELTRESQARARQEQLRRDLAMLEGQVSTTAAEIAVLAERIDKHVIRAPVDGEIGEGAGVPLGRVVREGERLGAIIPAGKLRIVAEFVPAAALGRVRAGQHARLLLDGFPWTQYGSVAATVASVANEVRDGRVRVELEPILDPPPRIPLQHGLPGTVEVEIERVAPSTLALRAAGRLVASPSGVTSPVPPAPSMERSTPIDREPR